MRALLLLIICSWFVACGGSSDDTNDNDSLTENPNAVTSTNPPTLEPRSIPNANEDVSDRFPESHDCIVEGEVYEGNQQWFRSRSVLVAITADASTFDEALGESHRVLVAYDTEDCSEIFREVLPISVSADYPYYLTSIDSLKGELIGILGADRLYVYDVANNQLSEPLNPEFKSNRQMADAQSGSITDVQTWGRYVIGFAEDAGSFVYNMTIPETPKQEDAFAEHKRDDGTYGSLFLLKAQDDKQQIVLPNYDMREREFNINPVLEEPAAVSQQINKSALNNRYIVIRLQDEARTPIAIDLETSERLELPENMKSKSTQEIVQWMKENG